MTRSREQRLVEVAVSMIMMAASDDFTEKDPEKIAEWIRRELDGCGFPSRGPVGITWVVLTERD